MRTRRNTGRARRSPLLRRTRARGHGQIVIIAVVIIAVRDTRRGGQQWPSARGVIGVPLQRVITLIVNYHTVDRGIHPAEFIAALARVNDVFIENPGAKEVFQSTRRKQPVPPSAVLDRVSRRGPMKTFNRRRADSARSHALNLLLRDRFRWK